MCEMGDVCVFFQSPLLFGCSQREAVHQARVLLLADDTSLWCRGLGLSA